MGRPAGWNWSAIVVWSLVAAWSAWAVIRLFGLEYGFPLEAMMAFTPIVAATAIVPVVAAVLARRLIAAVVAAVVLVVFAVLVLPRGFGGPTDAAGGNGPELRVLAANMKLGKGDPEALVDLVRRLDVDVLSVEELTPHLAGGLERAGLGDVLPNAAPAVDRGSSGSGLYTRLPMGPGTTADLPSGSPLITRTLALPGAVEIAVVSVHAHAPTSLSEWRDDLQALPAAGNEPTIMLGDFNATVDQEQFRDVVARGYEDVAETLGDGLTPTWPANKRLPALVTIDHVLADRRIGIRDYSVEDLPGTDHRAVYAELALPAG